MPAIQVARTDTFEQQRLKINEIGAIVGEISAGGSDLATGNLKIGDGSIPAPSLAFVSDETLGIYKSSTSTIGFVSSSKKLSDLGPTAVKYFRDFVLEKNSLDSLYLSVTNAGQNYDAGGYQDIPAIGGTGDGALLSLTVDGFQGTITNTGSGYTPGVYQNIPVSGGSGSGATINFTVADISGIISNAGSNYLPGTYTNVALTGGSGTGLTADIEVSAFSFDVQSGNGYPSGTFKSIALTGGSGTGFKANLVVLNGNVQSFGGVFGSVLVSSGSGYQVGDTLTYNFPTGVTQTFAVTAGGGKYYLDGVIANSFAMLRGNTYIFDASDASAQNHPLYIGSVLNDSASILGSADGVTYELDSVVVTPQDYLANYTTATTRKVTFVVPANPNNPTVYLNCSLHPDMGGSIDLVAATNGSNFSLEILELGGEISSVVVVNSGNGYSVGDVLGVNAADVGGSGSGFQFTLGGNLGSIEEITDIPDFGSGYQVGDVLTLATAVNNVSTFARGNLDFLGITLFSNASVQEISYAGSAGGSSPATYTNITPTVINSSGTGLTVTVVKTVPQVGNPVYDSVTIVNAGSGYRQGDQLRILGSVLGGSDGGNDLTITISVVEPANPQINIGDTTGIQVGDSVETIQNFNNTGQLAANTVVQSVDSASLITLSIAPPTAGTIDIRITNQNITYLTVPDSSGIKVGFEINQLSGTGELVQGTQVSEIINATTVAIGIQPLTAGPIVVNFEPTYGSGSGFQYTISDVGVVSDVTVSDGGNGYSPGDILQISEFNLVAPIEYLVTNKTVSKITFVSSSIPAASIQTGDYVRDAGGNILSSSVTSSTTLVGAADGVYTGVTPIATSGSGTGARFDLQRDNLGNIISAQVAIGYEGNFYAVNDTVTLPGASVGGATPADNVTITISNVGAPGPSLLVYKARSSGGFLQYLITESTSLSDGDNIVNVSSPTSGYVVNASTNEYRYFIDLQDGNGAQFTPDLTFYAGNTYDFDLSDPSNGSHVFAFSRFRDGQWSPSLFDDISTTLLTTSPQITIANTSGIVAGMAVEKVSGDGTIQDGTTVLSVDSATTLTLSLTPTASGPTVIRIFGAEYTVGVTRTDTSLSIKVTESTPTLYYYCDTDNNTHVNEGGDDNDEATITIDLNNPKTFGSGFTVLVTDVVRENVIAGDIREGLFTSIQIETTDLTAANGNITILESDEITSGQVTTPSLLSTTNFSATIDGTAIFETTTFGVASGVATTFSVDGVTGNTTTSGYFSSNNYRVGTTLRLQSTASTATITSLNGSDIQLIPDIGRITHVNTTTALAIPVGDSDSRPAPGVVRDGCIRYNSQTAQYEGYSSATTSWNSLGGVRDIDGNTYILAEKTVGANDNTLWFYNDSVNTVKFTPSYQEFMGMKKIRSLNTSAPTWTTWVANAPVSTGVYLKYRHDIYIVVSGGTTATAGNEPNNTTGATFLNGSATLQYVTTAVAPLTFEEISEIRIGPNKSVPMLFEGDLRITKNTISTDLTDINLRPNTGRKIVCDAKTHLTIPSGTENEKSTGTAANGSIRFNTTIQQYEGFSASTGTWSSLGGVRDVDGNTYIIPETAPGTNENILYFFNDNVNTLNLSKTGLDFANIDTITSTGSNSLEITASLVTIDAAATSIDNTSTTETFISTTKQNFDLGLSSGLTNDVVLRLDDQGDVYFNTGFGSGSQTLVRVFDRELANLEISKYRISTSSSTLTKGTTNNSSAVLYSPSTELSAKVEFIAHNTITGHKEIIEFSVIDSGTDIFYTEIGTIQTSGPIITYTIDFNVNNDVRLSYSLADGVANGNVVNVTVVSNVIKK